jgi:murein DD-endopeptidase MepM/ murein hydrolase activator NlpD
MVSLILLLSLAKTPVLSVSPGTVRAGGVVLLVVENAVEAPIGTLGDDELTFVACGKSYCALVPVALTSSEKSMPAQIEVEGQLGAVVLEGTVEVVAGVFAKRKLSVSSQFVRPSARQRQQQVNDQAAFDEAFGQDFTPLQFVDDFLLPRAASITAPFGDARVLNGVTKSRHFGIDLDGAVGDSIFAAQRGTVVMVRKCFTSGDTIVLDHGGRVFSAYFHLSSFSVRMGDVVRRGQLLGRVGNSGRVTGPHLHFGVKVDGRWVDPLSLIQVPFRSRIR